jgi:hypothetical protein
MILRQTLEEGGSFLNDIGIISTLESTQRGLQSSAVPKSMDSAKPTHHFGVNFDDFA